MARFMDILYFYYNNKNECCTWSVQLLRRIVDWTEIVSQTSVVRQGVGAHPPGLPHAIIHHLLKNSMTPTTTLSHRQGSTERQATTPHSAHVPPPTCSLGCTCNLLHLRSFLTPVVFFFSFYLGYIFILLFNDD